MLLTSALLALPLLLAGCPQQDAPSSSSGPSELEKKALEKGCPTMGSLAGDYLLVKGNSPDYKVRFRIMEDGGSFSMWYTDGGFGRRVMAGQKRDTDVAFTEVPSDTKKASFQAGQEPLKRLYVEPKLDRCALRVSRLDVTMSGGKEVERGDNAFVEFVRFPKTQEVSWHPCDGPLFLYDAAQKYDVAQKQIQETGSPKIDHPLGPAIPAAAWSDAAADGPESCSYDMDLFFDDLPVQEGGKAVPAGAVADGHRQWLVPAWKAPYSGNHHFELYRYKTCDAGKRELIGVSCLEAVLN